MVFALTSWIAPSAAWSMLRRHAADDVGTLKLVDLKLVKHEDDDYVAVHRTSYTLGDNNPSARERNSGDGGDGDDGPHLLIVDWSRQRMTNDTMGHLMSLSVSMEIKEKILDLAWGKLAPHSKLQSKLPKGDRGTLDQHLLPYNRLHDNNGKPKTTLDGLGRRKPWTPNCTIDDQFDDNSNDSNDDDEMGFEVKFNEQLALHNNTQEQRTIDETNATKLNSATRKYFEDQRRYDIVESNMRQQNNNNDDDNDNATAPTSSSENNGNKSGGSMHLAYRAPANKGLFMRDPYSNDKRKNVLDDIHNEWKRIQHISNNIRKGTTRGAIFGRPICDVLVVCAGGVDVGSVLPHALEFIYRSLEHDATAYMASLVDVNNGSVVGWTELVGATPPTTTTGGNSEATMEKKLKEVADGVVNMVTTPFKSKSSTGTTGGGIKSSTNASNSSGSSSSSSSSLRRRKLKILTSLDPSAMMEVLSDLNPATTVVISINIDSEGKNECQEITAFVKEWLLSMATTGITTTSSSSRRAQNEEIVSKHMYLVTTRNEISNHHHHQRRTKDNITSSSNTFVLPRHSQCEAFSTCSPAGLLPLSFIFGWDVISTILLGIHDMDIHFVDTCPRQNIPIILALIDVWNEAFLQSNGRILAPYVHAFRSYPRYVAALEHRVLNATANMPETKSFGSRGRNEEPQPVIDGGSNVYNNYGRGGGYSGGGGSSSSSSSSNLASTEFLTTLDPPRLPLVGYSSSTTALGSTSHEEQLVTNHDKRMCSLFARADTLAYGTSNTADHKARIFHSPGSPPTIIRNDTMTSQNDDDGGGGAGGSSAKIEIGNQPSTILFCGKCDAFTIGQLIALCEHRALIKAWLWGIDPFMITKSSGVQQERQEYLSEKLYIYINLLNEGVDLDEADGSNEKPSDSSTTGGGGGGGGGDGGGARMMNSATNTVLKHYATRLKHRRRDDKPRTPSRLFS